SRLGRRRLSHVRFENATALRLERLEDRFTPSAFSVLDSFSGSVSPGDGGASFLQVDSTHTSASGVDTTLRSGPAAGFQGAAAPSQLADSRSLILDWQGGDPSTASAGISGGRLDFSSGSDLGATLVLSYTNLSAINPEVLVSPTISFNYSTGFGLFVPTELDI